MTLPAIKRELKAHGVPHDRLGSKDKLWMLLTVKRGLIAKSENAIKPFGGPALEVLVSKVFTALWPYLTGAEESKGILKIMLSKELANHIPNYVELPKYFGPTPSTWTRKCNWKCKHICLCTAIAPPYHGWLPRERVSSIADNYQQLQDAWTAARNEWEITQEPVELKLSQELIDGAPSLNAVLPYDMLELIAKKITPNKDTALKALETKKDLACQITANAALLKQCNQELKQVNTRLARCGLSVKRAAAKAGTEFKMTPRIQKNKEILVVEVEVKLRMIKAAQEEHKKLLDCCNVGGVALSPRMGCWVPI